MSQAEALPVDPKDEFKPPAGSPARLEKLMEKNLQWSQVLYEQNKRVQRRLTLMAVGNYLRLLFLVVPIIVGAIFLPPLFQKVWQQYSELLGGSQAASPGQNMFSREQMNEVFRFLKDQNNSGNNQ